MNIYDGNTSDKTDFATDKYLQINSCGFQSSLPDYTVIRKTGRKDYHLLLIMNGVCKALHNEKLYTLQKGNLLIYAPGEEQKYTFVSDTTSLWCHFGGTIVPELLESCNLKSGAYFFKPSNTVYELYSSVIQRFHQPGMSKYANASLLELIYCISEHLKPEEKENSDMLLPILTYINANYNKKISLDYLAKKSGYSKSRFSHIFSEITGTTPIKYQNELRLRVSCEMLSFTELTVSNIAQSCGFSDPLYYSRIFKRKYNMSPTESRLSKKE